MITTWPVERIETEKRRLTVLQYLAQVPGYEASAHILVLDCRRRGVPTSADQMRAALAWLMEQELVSLRRAGEDTVARLKARGREAADGTIFVPGVLRPDP